MLPSPAPRSAAMAEQHESPNIDDLTPEEASRIIHSHRKVRYGTLFSFICSANPPLGDSSVTFFHLPAHSMLVNGPRYVCSMRL